MAPPMAGTCEVEIPPRISDMRPSLVDGGVEFGVRRQARFELLDAETCLLCADVLHIQAKYPCKFGQVVDVAAGCQQLQYTAVLDRQPLLIAQAIAVAIGSLVRHEFPAVLRIVERIAHLVERITLARHEPVE